MDYLTYCTKVITTCVGVYNVTPEEKHNCAGCHHPMQISMIAELKGIACQPPLINNSLFKVYGGRGHKEFTYHCASGIKLE